MKNKATDGIMKSNSPKISNSSNLEPLKGVVLKQKKTPKEHRINNRNNKALKYQEIFETQNGEKRTANGITKAND